MFYNSGFRGHDLQISNCCLDLLHYVVRYKNWKRKTSKTDCVFYVNLYWIVSKCGTAPFIFIFFFLFAIWTIIIIISLCSWWNLAMSVNFFLSNTCLERIFYYNISDCVLSMTVLDWRSKGDVKLFWRKVILDIAREARLHSWMNFVS